MTAKHRLIELSGHCSEVISFLDWIQAPDSLKSLALALQGFKALVPHLTDVIDKSEDISAIEPLQLNGLYNAACQIETILDSAKHDEALTAIQPNPKHKDPFHGVTLTAPLYVLVGTLARRGTEPRVELAAAVVICTAKELLSSERQGLDYRTAIATAMNAVRLSADSMLVPLLPSRMENLADYQAHLVSILDGNHPLTTALRSYVVSIERLIRFLLKVTGGARRGGRIVRDYDYPTNANPRYRLRVQQVTTAIKETVVLEERRNGLAAAELADDVEFVSIDTRASASPDVERNADTSVEGAAYPPSLAQQVMQRRAMIGQMERAAQLLPSDWTLLTHSECAYYLHGLRNELVSASGSITATDPENDRIRIEAIVALYVAFWAGRPFHTIPRLTLYATRSDLPQNFGPEALAYVIQDGDFIIPALRPQSAPRYKSADLTLAHSCTDHIVLPLQPYLSGAIRKLPRYGELRARAGAESLRAIRSVKAFTIEGDRLVNRMNYVLETINDHSSGRLTPSRISHYLFSAIGELTGDVALASLAAGRPHRLSDTALHYLSVVGEQLSQAAITATSQIERRAIDELIAQQAAPVRRIRTVQPIRTSGHVGSPIHPRLPVVQDLATRLRASINAAKLNVVSLQFRVDVHNALAQYLHWMLRFATGLRHVTVPLPGWDRIDRRRAIAYISDKDDVASYSSRIVPVPAMMLNQLVAWAEHCAILDDHLAGLRVAPSGKTNANEVIFYLSLKLGKIHIHSANSNVARSQLHSAVPHFKLPANCNRHYLRSTLAELQCPAELIDAFMGHWTRGREPWGRFSALSPHDYVECIRPFQEKMMESLGFSVVRGWA